MLKLRFVTCSGRRKEPDGQDLARERFKDPKFLKLRQKWYDKLKKKGFHDLEITDWSSGDSRECLDGISQADIVNTWSPEQERYYQLAVHWCVVMERRLTKKGADELELPRVPKKCFVEVWRMHADGKPYKAISARLKVPRSQVERVVREEKQLMLAFDWSRLDSDEGSLTLEA